MDSTAARGTAEWRRLDAAHQIHPFTDPSALATAGGARILVRGEGVYVVDSDGGRLLDATAGLGSITLGYGRSDLVAAARRQLETLACAPGFGATTTPAAVELAQRLADRTPPGLDRVFFSSSGSEAIDTAIRLIWRFWDLEDQPRRRILLSRERACHGSTVAAASLGALPGMVAMGSVMAGVSHVPAPCAQGERATPEEVGRSAADALEERILALDPERIAAFFAEPVQAAGGVILPPEGYWPRVQEICRRYDVLLVADEVACGFGRTGRWLGCDTYGIRPDLVTVGNSLTSGYLPLSATIVGDRVAGTLARRGGVLAHGYTASGHPASCAVGNAALRATGEEGLVERAREETGPYLARCLREALEGHPLVREVRGVGLLFGIEIERAAGAAGRLPSPGDLGARCVAHGIDCGILLHATGDCLCVSPPLVITRSEIDDLVERTKQAIDATATKARSA